ncbi:MAG: RimJ/RimL family protein N-acetyltransferase [Limisphaerales bacterium]|jgi:RimJ/RimL family protein N-acetyltransferase
MHLDMWQGHQVHLRALHTGDAETIALSHLDSDGWRHGDDVKPPVAIETVMANIASKIQPKDDNIWLAIVDSTGEMVGNLNVHGADPRHAGFEYGIHILREHRMLGYASDAIRLLMRYYFEELSYQRMWSTVYEFNRPSIELHKRLGFVEEGRLRRSVRTGGKYWDEFLFGILADEAMAQIEQLPPLPSLNS